MKVCIDTRWVSNQNSGIGRYINLLLNKVKKEECPFDLSYFGSKIENQKIDYIPLEGFKKKIFQFAWKTIGIPKLESITGNQDLFHFTNMTAVPNKAKKTVLTIHDLAYLKFPETIESKNLSFLDKTVPWSVENAGHIIAVSEATKSDIIDYFGYPADRISVIYNGLDDIFLSEPSGAVKSLTKRKYGLTKEFILSVSTIEPRKDFYTMIEGYSKIDKTLRKQYDLLICGGVGWSGEYKRIVKLIHKLGLQGNVKILGFTSPEELRALYNMSSLYLHTSLYEGFGMGMVEAMSQGVPVIASETSCHPEILGDSALYFKVSDAQDLAYQIELALTDNERRTVLGKKAMKRSKDFSWEEAAQKTVQVYKDTLLGY